FAGSLDGVRAKKGIFVTTSSSSAEARQYVERIDKRIVLIDGGGADPRREDEAGGSGGGGGGEGGRPVGRGLRAAQQDRSPGGPRRGARGEPAGGRVLPRAEFAEPLRDSLPHPRREEAGDAGAAHREVRRHARARREDLLNHGESWRRRSGGLRLTCAGVHPPEPARHAPPRPARSAAGCP